MDLLCSVTVCITFFFKTILFLSIFGSQDECIVIKKKLSCIKISKVILINEKKYSHNSFYTQNKWS